MAKKKITKKIPVASSFFSMHRHARWLLGVFIIVTIIFIGISHKADVQQSDELDHLVIQATNATISWKTYTNPVGKFSIQYPANWKLVESHEKSNKAVDDPKEINTATLSGEDGEMVLQWGDMGFGGGCEQKDAATLRLKEMSVPICKGVTDGTIHWSQVSPGNREPAFSAYATTNQAETEDVITNIFGTLSFTK